MAGFGFTTYAEVDLSFLDPWTRFAVLLFATVSLLAALMCVCHSTYVTIWGPSLALRGQTAGDMERALSGMRVGTVSIRAFLSFFKKNLLCFVLFCS